MVSFLFFHHLKGHLRYKTFDTMANKNSKINDISLKGNAQFIFLCNPQKSSVNACLMKILESTVTKKVVVCFYNLGEENY